MKEEICAAVTFLTDLMGKSKDLTPDQVEIFHATLGSVLIERFEGHWFPEKPYWGQAYRCIRVNGRERRDPVLERAAQMCGLRYQDLHLPPELTLWVDPKEVCCRFGEDEGSYCTVASFKDNKENLSDNYFIQDSHLKSFHQNAFDYAKKQKSRRKAVDSQRKTSVYPVLNKGHQSLNPKPVPSTRYLDWGAFHPEMTPFVRRSKKPTRIVYSNNRRSNFL
ncbi:protein BTG4-like [Uloborus diversus]|uniref:protein BTG4-like n=1 Tax=Uloborus diversus TaxID=327109 RepID=UPI0024097AA6|nr:protein BTG4-like [Uloborus diversus]XP_054716995.1 protein BTG4-like [Uloborus diversus]